MLIRRGGGDLNDFKFGTVVGCFPSDGAARMAVKGLTTEKPRDAGGKLGECRRPSRWERY